MGRQERFPRIFVIYLEGLDKTDLEETIYSRTNSTALKGRYFLRLQRHSLVLEHDVRILVISSSHWERGTTQGLVTF